MAGFETVEFAAISSIGGGAAFPVHPWSLHLEIDRDTVSYEPIDTCALIVSATAHGATLRI
jgi:hypothetical protein